jgi:hypothetical protein
MQTGSSETLIAWLDIWQNYFFPSMETNGGSMTTDSDIFWLFAGRLDLALFAIPSVRRKGILFSAFILQTT